VTDDVRRRLDNADTVEGKAAFVDAVNAFMPGIGGGVPLPHRRHARLRLRPCMRSR
jgi:hypothetical protein